MGCASSTFLNNDDDRHFPQLGSSVLSHHFVSLTSTTYGLLNLDPPPPPTTSTPSRRLALSSVFNTPSIPDQNNETPEVINSWELMSGLNDTDSFRFSPDKENRNPNLNERSDLLCPPRGENRVVIYTTTLRGVRETFESCNLVRASIEAFGVEICERDMSMDKGFREELRKLLIGFKDEKLMVPPRVFIKGRYIGGCEEVMRVIDDGLMGALLQGVPKRVKDNACEGCGGVRFLPCFSCFGSCKIVKEELGKQLNAVVVRCGDCNENGLILCPICS